MRLNIEISEKKMRHLEDIMQHTGIETKKELFNTAIALFKWAVIERSKGNVIASLDEETGDYKELLIPALENLRPTNIIALSDLERAIMNKEELINLLGAWQSQLSYQLELDTKEIETELEQLSQLETVLEAELVVAGD